MNKVTWILCCLLIVITPQLCLAEVPHTLSGIVLGGELSSVADRLIQETIMPVRHLESLKEGEVEVPPGFKTGLITYTTCEEPWRVVRMRFKYENNSKKFYDQLLKRYKSKFGKPDEWRGDPFHVTIAWKWKFVDAAGNHISMILQHNTKDQDEKKGNSVKMTMWNLIDQEAICFKKAEAAKAGKKATKPGSVDWKQLIPH